MRSLEKDCREKIERGELLKRLSGLEEGAIGKKEVEEETKRLEESEREGEGEEEGVEREGRGEEEDFDRF